jgi:hypothetical protein
MVKNLAIGLVVCTLFSEGLYGQTTSAPERAVHLGYGFLSDMQIMLAFSNTYGTISSAIAGDPVSIDYSSTGPIIAGLNFFTSKRVTIGPELNILQLKRTQRYEFGAIVKDQFFIVSISGRVDYRYLMRDAVQLYSGLSLGGAYIVDQSVNVANDRSGFFIAYQLNLFGIRVGKSWAGYAEFGFGRNGLLHIGIAKAL